MRIIPDTYAVIVGNLGTVLTTPVERLARKEFNHYVRLSKQGLGRAAHESVSLTEEGEIIKEYLPRKRDTE